MCWADRSAVMAARTAGPKAATKICVVESRNLTGMKQQKKKGQSPEPQPEKLPSRRRGQGDVPPTIPKSYTVPFDAILDLRRLAPEYGSQGRALQVASEIAIRMRRPPQVEEPDPDTLMRMTYKLPPRTIRVIEELARNQYGSAGKAIVGCVEALKIKKLD